MRILVTGGGGFAGLHLLRELSREKGIELSATQVGAAPSPGTLSSELSGVAWYSMDVTSSESVIEVVRRVQPDRVYHLAGQASVGESFQAPLTTWEVNATGTLRLLDALARESPRTERLLLASSAEVYGAVPRDEQPIREDRPYRPVTPYGASKAAAEVAALQAGAGNAIDVVVARSFNHIGPGQGERFVMPSMARQLVQFRAAGEQPIVRVGNLEVDRDFLDVRDVARAYVRLMEDGEAGMCYNVCSGQPRSLLDVVSRLVEISGTGARLEIDPRRVRPADIPALAGDAHRLRALGWSPMIELDDTLHDLLAEALASKQTED